MLSPELRATLDAAIQDTRRRRHEYITLEHLLLALLDDPTAREVLTGCNAEIERLRGELETFLEQNVPKLPEEGGALVFVLSASVRRPIPALSVSNGLRPGLAMHAPYPVLADPDSAGTAAWVEQQNAVTDAYLAGLPDRSWFTETMQAVVGRPRAGVPFKRAGERPTAGPQRPANSLTRSSFAMVGSHRSPPTGGSPWIARSSTRCST